MINITLPDGAVRQYEDGITALDVAKSISEGLARKVLAANVNGIVWDATRPINDDAKLTLLTWQDKDGQTRNTTEIIGENFQLVRRNEGTTQTGTNE